MQILFTQQANNAFTFNLVASHICVIRWKVWIITMLHLGFNWIVLSSMWPKLPHPNIWSCIAYTRRRKSCNILENWSSHLSSQSLVFFLMWTVTKMGRRRKIHQTMTCCSWRIVKKKTDLSSIGRVKSITLRTKLSIFFHDLTSTCKPPSCWKRQCAVWQSIHQYTISITFCHCREKDSHITDYFSPHEKIASGTTYNVNMIFKKYLI